jgi:hypothetical protein
MTILRMVRAAGLVLCAMLVLAAPALAQDPPPKIPLFVADVHGVVPKFPVDAPLADSHKVVVAELPGRGLGLQVGAHLYLLHWRAITFGIGGEYIGSSGRQTPPASQSATLRAVDERFKAAGSQLSFNFGNGFGWSYISGGIGTSTWSAIADGSQALPVDLARLKTINYGGGARWFAKKHVGFSFDVRFYAINPGPPGVDSPGSPRTTMLVIGAGVSLK